MASVKQTLKMIPFITCEISLGQYVCELVSGVNVFDLDFWSPNWFDRTTNHEQLCGFWKHVSIVGLLPLIIILITASLTSNTYNKASWWEDGTFEGIKSTLSKSLITLWDCLRLWVVWGGEQASRLFTMGLSVLSWFWIVSPRTETIRSHKSRARIPSISIQRPKRWFRIVLSCA